MAARAIDDRMQIMRLLLAVLLIALPAPRLAGAMNIVFYPTTDCSGEGIVREDVKAGDCAKGFQPGSIAFLSDACKIITYTDFFCSGEAETSANVAAGECFSNNIAGHVGTGARWFNC